MDMLCCDRKRVARFMRRIVEPNGLVVRPLPQGGCMDASRASAKVFRFGSFEASVHSGELRCEGMRIHLQGQPFLGS